MQQAEYDYNDFNETAEADKALLVRFYVKSVQNIAETEAKGRPVFREKEYIEIRYAGNRSDAIARPASEKDKARFPRHYEAFKQRVEMPEEGTPLSEWPVVSRSQAEELAFYNIKTVEQLAACSSQNGSKFMGFNTLQEKAKKFLELSTHMVEAGQLKDELDKRDKEVSELTSVVAKLKARLDATEKAAATEVKAEVPSQPRDEEPAPKPSRRRRSKPE